MNRTVRFQTAKGNVDIDLDRITELRRGTQENTIIRADSRDFETVVLWKNLLEDIYQAIHNGNRAGSNEISGHLTPNNPFEDQGERGFVPPEEQFD